MSARRLLVVLGLVALGTAARAQTPQPPVTRPTARDTARRDSTQRDSTRRDSTTIPVTQTPRELVKWAPSDSIIEALLKRKGYHAVRYQGDTVTFRNQQRELTLRGVPAAVQRDETLLVGREVVYNDSTQIVVATADTAKRDSVVLHDPAQGADVVVRTSIRYDLATQRGTIRNFSTSATQGETWFVSGQRGTVVTDTTVNGGRIFFAHNGSITSCSDSVPHYHFQARDIKYVTKSLVVVRPAVLYIGDVPVLWLPFVFQDTRSGRRSGILSPRFGVAELVRNSSNYHRSLENLGYYFNLGNYADAMAWVDWRSGAGGTTFDPGWVRFNAESQYRVTNRFLQGRIAAGYLAQRDGSRNTTVSLAHEQSFNQNRRLSANVNWAQSTTLQRQNTLNPNQVLGTIASQLNYQDKLGPFSFSAGGSRKQYPGRPQVDQDFPNVNLTSRTIGVTKWLDWTPGLNFTNTQSFHIDQGTQFDSVYRVGAGGALTASSIKASRRATTLGFETPLKIASWTWQNSIRFDERVEDFPQTRDVYRDIADTTTKERRVFNQTYVSNIFYQTGFQLPSFFRGTWNLTPSFTFQNIDPSFGLFVRTERTGGQWVRQGFRYSFGVSSSPTLYGFLRGFGPVERFRHSISPIVSFNYSPAAKVSNEFLAAVGTTKQGYLGSLTQSRASLGLSTSLEAKVRQKGAKGDSGSASAGGDQGQKVKVLSANFSSISYDFIIADSVGRSFFNQRGFTDPNWSYTLSSDLLPGASFRSNYSLFLGNPQSDSAVFKPYLTDVNLSFTLDRNSALFRTIGKLFGYSPSTPAQNSPNTATTERGNPRGGDAFFSNAARQAQVAGSGGRNAQFDIPQQDFRASVTFTSARQRPDLRGNIVTIDPAVQCQAFRQAGDVINYELCLGRAATAPPAGTVIPGSTTYGGAIFRQPPTKSMQANMSFHLTQKWATTWNTTYDLVRSSFASNVVSLQRELHDWRAVFAFTQAQNGNFAFNFFVALKAEPDLKFDYNRNTYRAPSSTNP